MSRAKNHDLSGSSIKHILITEDVAKRKQAPIYLARGQQHRFYAMIAAEEEEWEARMRKASRDDGTQKGPQGTSGSFEEYREKSKAAGVM